MSIHAGAREPMAARDQTLNDRISAAQELVRQGNGEDAIPLLTAALRFRPLGPEEEARIRSLLSEAHEIGESAEEALEAVAKYQLETPLATLRPRSRVRPLVRVARAWEKLGDQPKAIGFLNSALKAAEESGDKEGVGLAYLAKGSAYRQMNEGTIATDSLDRALEQFRLAGNRGGIAQSYLELGLIGFQEGDDAFALAQFEAARAIIQEEANYFLLGAIHFNTSQVLIRQQNITAAMAELEKARELFTRAKQRKMLARVCASLGRCLLHCGEWVRAEATLTEALELSRSHLDGPATAAILEKLARLFLLTGRAADSRASLREALALVEPLDVPAVSLRIHSTLTRLFLSESEFESAQQGVQSCSELAARTGDALSIARCALLRSEVKLASHQDEEASAMLARIEGSLVDKTTLPELGTARRLRGELLRRARHFDEAKHNLQQSLSIFETLGDSYEIAVANQRLAGLCADTGEREEARRRLHVALDAFRSLGATPAVEESQRGLKSLESAAPPSAPVEPSEEDLISGPLIVRIVDAASNFDLLCTEIVCVALEITEAPGAMLCRKNAGSEGYELKSAKGISEERKQTLLSAISSGDRAGILAYELCPHFEQKFLLLLDRQDALPPTVARHLEAVLMLFEQGLELTQLRTRKRAAKTSRPAAVQQESLVPGFVYSSAAVTRLIEQILKIKSSDVTVLITGESGTGKELIARAIHAHSARKDQRFIPFNCTATTRDLVDSHLFGHRKGAFTGATSDSLGVIRAAENGTLFLDEVGDLALDVQPKLLRFLQEGEIQPLGEDQPLKVNVRVIAATNCDLELKVKEGSFREDLFHRINVIRLHVPPLRERREEIPLFIEHFLNLYSGDMRKPGITLSQEAIDLMVLFDWPGNVRQLSNELRRIVAMAEAHSVVAAEMLSKEISQPSGNVPALVREQRFGGRPSGIFIDATQPLADAVSQLEKGMLLDVLQRNKGNISKAARELGVTRRSLYNKKERLGVE